MQTHELPKVSVDAPPRPQSCSPRPTDLGSRTMNNALLETLEQSLEWVAQMTGMKQQFVDAGWSDVVAEHMVLAALQLSVNR